MSGVMQADASLDRMLLASANGDGGWGYFPTKTSRIEPTAWALLALHEAKDHQLAAHRRFLLACQRESGLFVEDPGLPPNLGFNALAAVLMLRDPSVFGEPRLRRLLAALVAQAGQTAGPAPPFRQDNTLRGWPWVEGTFSWIEPTAWALIALKIARRRGLAPAEAAERIAEAERLLIDRCCRDGGWNYGNSNAFGKELRPYVPTTALSLLAMQDRRDVPEVRRSLTYLASKYADEPSTLALSLSAMCLRRYSQPFVEALDRLTASLSVARSVDNLHAIAIACYASALPSSEVDAFAL